VKKHQQSVIDNQLSQISVAAVNSASLQTGVADDQKKTQLLLAKKQCVLSLSLSLSLFLLAHTTHTHTHTHHTLDRETHTRAHAHTHTPRRHRIVEEELQLKNLISQCKVKREAHEAQRRHPDLLAPMNPETAAKRAAEAAVAAAQQIEKHVAGVEKQCATAKESADAAAKALADGGEPQEALVTEKEFIELAKRPPRPRCLLVATAKNSTFALAVGATDGSILLLE